MYFRGIFYLIGCVFLLSFSMFMYGEYKLAIDNEIPYGYQLSTHTPLKDKLIVNDYCILYSDFLNQYSSRLADVLNETSAHPFKSRNKKEETLFAFNVGCVFDYVGFTPSNQLSKAISDTKKQKLNEAFREVELANTLIKDIKSTNKQDMNYYCAGILPRNSTLVINSKFAEANVHINKARTIINNVQNMN